MDINNFIKSLVTEGVSDIHLKAGRPPLCRYNGVLTALNEKPLSPEDTANIATSILEEDVWEKLKDVPDYDGGFSIPGFSRFRVNIFKQRGTISLVMRVVSYKVPDLDDLGLPPVVKDLALIERGLILVTGAAGNGKSSTLAGMIKHINQNTRCHIITIEDPIEFLHRDELASINQREVGIDVLNFADALRAALRQDPNIILVGEIRDLETMEIALRAAETGHLVFSTLHTTDAVQTVTRLVESFPQHQQNQARVRIASTLKAVISQRLLERNNIDGRVLAVEIMIVNAAIKEYLSSPYQADRIRENIEKGAKQYGMQTFDQAIMKLVQDGTISIEEALQNATSPNDLKLKLSVG